MAKAVETSVPVEVHAIGNVEAWSSVQIKSQVAGILTHVDFTEGQEVHKGQLLFQIDPRPYQDTYNQAAAAVARDQAQLQQAQANQARDEAQSQNAEVLANRYAELLKDGVVSKEQHESYATTANMQREALRSDQAAIAEKEKQWFAVAFHVGRLLLDAPDDAGLKRRRDEALRKHEATVSQSSASIPLAR